MPEGASVRPKKWTDIELLFDDETYSVISGRYEDGAHPVLGTRWNGGVGNLGFPNVAGNPVWHVVPEFLATGILESLLLRLAGETDSESQELCRKIKRELSLQYSLLADELATRTAS